MLHAVTELTRAAVADIRGSVSLAGKEREALVAAQCHHRRICAVERRRTCWCRSNPAGTERRLFRRCRKSQILIVLIRAQLLWNASATSKRSANRRVQPPFGRRTTRPADAASTGTASGPLHGIYQVDVRTPNETGVEAVRVPCSPATLPSTMRRRERHPRNSHSAEAPSGHSTRKRWWELIGRISKTRCIRRRWPHPRSAPCGVDRRYSTTAPVAG